MGSGWSDEEVEGPPLALMQEAEGTGEGLHGAAGAVEHGAAAWAAAAWAAAACWRRRLGQQWRVAIAASLNCLKGGGGDLGGGGGEGTRSGMALLPSARLQQVPAQPEDINHEK